MVSLVVAFQHFLSPPVPQDVRDDFVMMQFQRLQSQIPLLYIATTLSTIAATWAIGRDSGPLIGIGVPAMVILACVGRFIIWARRRSSTVSVQRAATIICQSTIISSAIILLCTTWTVFNWLGSPPGSRVYVSYFMAMGSLSVAYCLSTIRTATLANLAIGLLPLSILQLFWGDHMDRSVGGGTLVATMFLIRLIHQQHVQLIDLLVLQRRMHAQANTDSLTGLLNRRALYQQVAERLAQGPATLMLLDLDGFKPVNDNHGHAAGDALLCQVAERLLASCSAPCVVARLGGDEFAILVPEEAQRCATTLADQLLASLVVPFTLPQGQVRISASLGLAVSPQHGITVDELMLSADHMLYAAKDLHYQQQTPTRTLRVSPLVATR